MRLREGQGLRLTEQSRGSRLLAQCFFPGFTSLAVEFPLRIPSKSDPKGLSSEGWEPQRCLKRGHEG